MKLWLCLRFTHLALHCITRSEHKPVAVIDARRVLQANDLALALGIKPGMGIDTVRALAGTDIELPRPDDAARQRHLQQLCCWGYGITPELHTWRADCLLLEIGGCLMLHGGLQNLLARIEQELARRGERWCPGLAATPLAAWLLSFTPRREACAIHRPLAARLAPLPLELLDRFPQQVSALQRAGLHSLGDLLALPRRELALRCGSGLSDFLARALGQQSDLRESYRPPAAFRDSIWFGYEITDSGELAPAIRTLLESLCRFLRNRQLETSRIDWELWHGSRTVQRLTVRSRAGGTRAQSWQQLTCIQLERNRLPRRVEGITLHADEFGPQQQTDNDLFSGGASRESPDALLDRLVNRLGMQALQHLVSRDEHLPEAATLSLVADSLANESCAAARQNQRPFWLMAKPAPLAVHESGLRWHGRLEPLYGPERIEDNWWQQPVSRDYYIARDEADGHYYWIFLDRLQGQWFLHGIFA